MVRAASGDTVDQGVARIDIDASVAVGQERRVDSS